LNRLRQGNLSETLKRRQAGLAQVRGIRIVQLGHWYLHAAMPDTCDLDGPLCEPIIDQIFAGDERPKTGNLQTVVGVTGFRKLLQ
jgi:hypothetical protein